MADLTEIKKNLELLRRKCRRRARARTLFYAVCFWLSTTLLPIHHALYLGFKDDGPSWWGFVFWILVGLHLFCTAFLCFAGQEDIVEQAYDLEEALQEIERGDYKYKVCVDRHQEISIFVDRIKPVLELAQIFNNDKSLIETSSMQSLSEYVLGPFLPFIQDIFSYKESSCYNLAIYVYSEKSRELVPCFRYRDARLARERPQPSRSWPVGVGHVGKCYAHNTAFIDPDITTDPLFDRARSLDNDRMYYRSAISVPLRRLEAMESGSEEVRFEKQIYGVLLLTSSVPDQFSKLHLEFMRVLKYILENLLAKCDSEDAGCLLKR